MKRKYIQDKRELDFFRHQFPKRVHNIYLCLSKLKYNFSLENILQMSKVYNIPYDTILTISGCKIGKVDNRYFNQNKNHCHEHKRLVRTKKPGR